MFWTGRGRLLLQRAQVLITYTYKQDLSQAIWTLSVPRKPHLHVYMFVQIGVPFVGVLPIITRTLLCGVSYWAPIFWKVPYTYMDPSGSIKTANVFHTNRSARSWLARRRSGGNSRCAAQRVSEAVLFFFCGGGGGGEGATGFLPLGLLTASFVCVGNRHCGLGYFHFQV